MGRRRRELVRTRERRQALELIGSAGVSALVGCGGSSAGSGSSVGGGPGAESSCIVRPAQTEGPYFVDRRLHRSDIRSDPASGTVKEGVPLRVMFRIARASRGECVALAGATVDLWQCDALGIYGDALDASFDTRGQLFLRGFQLTDAAGMTEFLTIYPGWYVGRTIHLHFKVRAVWNDAPFEFTSQIYFAESVNDRVMARAPYDARGPRSTMNAMDGIFAAGGDALVLPLVEDGDGFSGTFELGLEL